MTHYVSFGFRALPFAPRALSRFSAFRLEFRAGSRPEGKIVHAPSSNESSPRHPRGHPHGQPEARSAVPGTATWVVAWHCGRRGHRAPGGRCAMLMIRGLRSTCVAPDSAPLRPPYSTREQLPELLICEKASQEAARRQPGGSQEARTWAPRGVDAFGRP